VRASALHSFNVKAPVTALGQLHLNNIVIRSGATMMEGRRDSARHSAMGLSMTTSSSTAGKDLPLCREVDGMIGIRRSAHTADLADFTRPAVSACLRVVPRLVDLSPSSTFMRSRSFDITRFWILPTNNCGTTEVRGQRRNSSRIRYLSRIGELAILAPHLCLTTK
jgi:hypothetical protein